MHSPALTPSLACRQDTAHGAFFLLSMDCSGQSFPSRKLSSVQGLPLWNHTAHPQLYSSSSLAVPRRPGSALKTPEVTHEHQKPELKHFYHSPKFLSQMKEQRNDSALEPGTSRTPETNNMCTAAASNPQPFSSHNLHPRSQRVKHSWPKCFSSWQSPGWGSGGGEPAALSPVRRMVPMMPGSSWENLHQ